MSLSGGQKQRLFIALALINDPEVVFLDELTTGLDPQARRAIWDLVNGIRARGKTVFLTTHLMEEAERLCDRVAIIEHGRLIEMGAPADLVAQALPRARRRVHQRSRGPRGRPRAHRRRRVGARRRAPRTRSRGAATTSSPRSSASSPQHALTVRDFRTVFPTLEDVFLKLTGHAIRD